MNFKMPSAQGINQKVNELGNDVTREEIKATIDSFKENNQDRFEEIKETQAFKNSYL